MKISYSSGTKLKYQIQWTICGCVCQWSPHELQLFFTHQLDLLNQFMHNSKYHLYERQNMSLYKESDICCFYFIYRLEKVVHSTPNYIRQDMGTPPEREVINCHFFWSYQNPSRNTASFHLYFSSIFLAQDIFYSSWGTDVTFLRSHSWWPETFPKLSPQRWGDIPSACLPTDPQPWQSCLQQQLCWKHGALPMQSSAAPEQSASYSFPTLLHHMY